VRQGTTGMLKDLFDKYDCDKGAKHHYHLVYEPYFKPRRTDPINILEVGTYLGASTSALHEYFPNANIYTIDIFERTDPKTLGILKKERVHWLKSDSTSNTLGGLIQKEWGDVKFDFIIDDGAHYPKANHLTFQNLYGRLNEDGTYFIEDVWAMELMSYQEIESNNWFNQKAGRYIKEENDLFVEEINKHSVKRYDHRKLTSKGDSYIIAVREND
jgi:predicted O-methyltransferase YrrM